MKLRAALFFAGLCVIAGQAHAGLFSDDEAHLQIQKLEGRISRLEEKLQETGRQQAENSKQQTQAMLDLQSQIENLNTDLRKLRGQNEELVHTLQDTERRQRDFYVDLDSRVRHFEALETATPVVVPTAPVLSQSEKAADGALEGPAVENRAYEAAYSLSKAGNQQKAISAYQEFLKKYPDSVYIPNVHFDLGNAYFASKEYQKALNSYQELLDNYGYSNKAQDALLGIADCQQGLHENGAARKTLKQIISKYPGSDTAVKAKKRLAALK